MAVDPRPPPMTFRETPDDKRRLRTLVTILGGSKTYVVRLAIARLAREVGEANTAGGADAVRALVGGDLVAVLDPIQRASARTRARRIGKARKAAPVPDAQPSAER